MKPMQGVDALVIGLGPAGSSAARVLAEHGLQVLAVERREEIGVPVQCAEYIPLTIATHANREGIRQQSVNSMKSWLEASQAIVTDMPGLMIDRARFDQSLAAMAGEAGAEIRTATRLLALDPGRGRASLQTGKQVEYIDYDYLVAADGPRSTVARQLGLETLDSLYSYQITVNLRKPMQDTEVWLDGRFPGGYAWLFPLSGTANLGAAGYGEQAGRLKSGLEQLHGQLVAEGRLGKLVLYRTGGPIPVGGLRESLVMGRHLFVGDAAGLCHPITGAGIASAIDSGIAAGETIAAHRLDGNLSALEEYACEMRERYGASHGHAVARRRELRAHWLAGDYDEGMNLRRSWIACKDYFDGEE